MKKRVVILISAVVLGLSALALPDMASAQPPPPPGKPTQTPVDGGLGLLVAAGGAYAVKKLRDRSKEQDRSQERMIGF